MRAIVQCIGRRVNLSPFVSVWNWCRKCCKPCFTPSVLWSGRVWTEEIGKGLWILIFIRPVFLVSFTYRYTLIINWWLWELLLSLKFIWSPDTTLAQQGDIHGDTMGRKHPYTVQEIANRLSYPSERKSCSGKLVIKIVNLYLNLCWWPQEIREYESLKVLLTHGRDQLQKDQPKWD